jgi:hypothetical protein
MHRFRIHEMVFGFLLASVIWALGVVAQSSQPAQQPSQNQRASHTPNEASKGEDEKSLWKPNDPVSLYTLVLAFFSGLLVVVSFIQIRFLTLADRTARISAIAARRAANASRKSAGVSEQALLMVETPYLVPQITECKIRTTANNEYEVDLGNTVTYYINNYGRTPATIYDIYACLLPARGFPAQLDTTGLQTNLTMTEIIPANNRSVDHHFYLNDGLMDSLFGDKKDADQYIIFFCRPYKIW